MSESPFLEAMTFKVLIIEDNHSFIDSLKVMLRDLPLDFSHAFRYSDALNIMEKSGIFHNRQPTALDPAGVASEQAAATVAIAEPARKRGSHEPKHFHEGGVFLVIVEQNTESSMKGTDFIAHATRKFPQLAESDFILMTHRIELVPAKNHNFPVLEKPLRAPQIRQLVQQKIKQAQDLIDMQIQALQQKNEKPEKPAAQAKPPRKGLRDLLKMNRNADEVTDAKVDEKKSPKKTKTKKTTGKTGTAKKAKPK